MSQRKKASNRKQKEKRAKAKARARRGLVASTARAVGPAGPPAATLPENRRFNRQESKLDHFYFTDYGFRGDGSTDHNGWLKCRLLHGQGYSLIVPDQIYLERAGLLWIQPLAFGPNRLAKLSDEEFVCDLDIDVSCGHRLRLRFFNHDHVLDMADGSQLFKCKIRGPADLHTFATGNAEWGSGGVPYIRLFHHTTPEAVPLILGSRQFRSSPWNIQGASKQLQNVAYAYFTPLDAIKCESDLRKIAMSEGGTIELRRDGFTPPPILLPDYLERFKNDILQLQVYRCDPTKREANVDMWIDASVLAPQHVYRHDEGGPVYYELPHPFIHRVGAVPGNTIGFDDKRRIHRHTGLKHFDYVVVGDCTVLSGLAAPYDEEDTTHILKIERIPAGQTLLAFWFAHGNTDLFSRKAVEMQEFKPGGGSP